MIFNINSTRGQTRFLTCVARVTCLVGLINGRHSCGHGNQDVVRFNLIVGLTSTSITIIYDYTWEAHVRLLHLL